MGLIACCSTFRRPLASTLAGKTFDVDDGFLKKIRVAQFQPGKTRIVLEVNDLSATTSSCYRIRRG